MKIAIAADHAGFSLKEELKNWIADSFRYEVEDIGTYSTDSVDYPDYAHALAQKVEDKQVEAGVLICGSGNGVCITANKHKGVRAAMAWLPEIAELAKQHNNANIICLPARFIDTVTAQGIITSFFTAKFEGGRHEKRVEKI